MRIQFDLFTFGWADLICVIIVLLSIPELRRRVTEFGVFLFAQGYRFHAWAETTLFFWKPKRSETEKEEERQFKLLSPQEVATQLREETEYRNLSGVVSFKWGFPYIFRQRHLQLFKTMLIVRDADQMKKYTANRLQLVQQQRLARLESKNNSSTSSPSSSSSSSSPVPPNPHRDGDEIDSAQDQQDLVDNQQEQEQLSLQPITSRTLPPPKPLMIFNLSNGKAVNSRLPMTLKLVSANSEASYLQFKDTTSYAIWCKAISENLHIELVEGWKAESRTMISTLQHEQNIAKLQQSTPIKKRPVLKTAAGTLQI